MVMALVTSGIFAQLLKANNIMLAIENNWSNQYIQNHFIPKCFIFYTWLAPGTHEREGKKISII